MSKFFSEFPSELEQYNPEDLFAELKLTNSTQQTNLVTVNDEGFLHSNEDFPSSIKGDLSTYFIKWHQHGQLARLNDKPVAVRMGKNFYETYDSNDKRHSYNDNPAVIEKSSNAGSFILQWYNHGFLERESDKPSILNIQGGMTELAVYYKANCYHRAYNLPAVEGATIKLWAVENLLHNITGPAKIMIPLGWTKGFSEWHLYGIKVTEDEFEKVLAYQTKNQTPLWLALFKFFNLVSDDSVTKFVEEFSNEKTNLPIKWVLQAFSINEKIWNNFAVTKTSSNYSIDYSLECTAASFYSFLKVIQHEESLSHELQITL
jgi:hypothetical protein